MILRGGNCDSECDSEIIRVEIKDLNENQEVNILDILIIVNLV